MNLTIDRALTKNKIAEILNSGFTLTLKNGVPYLRKGWLKIEVTRSCAEKIQKQLSKRFFKRNPDYALATKLIKKHSLDRISIIEANKIRNMGAKRKSLATVSGLTPSLFVAEEMVRTKGYKFNKDRTQISDGKLIFILR